MLRTEISTLAGYGNSINTIVDNTINEITLEEQEKVPRWFNMAAGTQTLQDEIDVASTIPHYTGQTPNPYYDQDNNLAVVTIPILFEDCPTKFQEYIGYKVALRMLRQQGLGEDDLKELIAALELITKDLGALHLAFRSGYTSQQSPTTCWVTLHERLF